MSRPTIYVLAGVNGAGKSSVGSRALAQAGLSWFNPDTYARDLAKQLSIERNEANGLAWQEGFRQLNEAIANQQSYAFETTLGGNSIAATLRGAAATHDVLMWFCGLDSPEHHLARIKLRVSQGGHDIPEAKVRERYTSSRLNLIALLPHLAALQVYDNSADAPLGQPVADPFLLLQMEGGKVTSDTSFAVLQNIPVWARPIMEAALSL